jgi:peptidoglycan/LPS O-acetylase OafA/YrhL
VSAKPQHPTAWLDGLRGIAAFLVFIYHFQHMFHTAYMYGYGGNDGKNDNWLIQLPIIRLLCTGGPMVSIFWVLSGVSLSLKPLQLARSATWDKFFDTLFSSVFRRMLRLYLPVFVVQVAVLTATLLGMFNFAYARSKDWHFSGTNETMHEVFDSNTEQIKDWIKAMWKFANPFRPNRPVYDVHLWTIPLEFRNSIILFATLVGLSKLKPKVRIVLTWVLWAFCMLVNEGDVALFIAGMGIAEYMVIQDETHNSKTLPSSEATASTPATQTTLQRASWAVLSIFSLHLLSWPSQRSKHALGYVTLTNLTPSIFNSAHDTWSRIGAAVFVFALCNYELLRRPFQTPLAIYLGKISFPLYIVHGPINHILGIWLVEMYWKMTGNQSFVGYEAGVILAFCTETVVVVWLADLVMRTVDTPGVRFGRTLQNRWTM